MTACAMPRVCVCGGKGGIAQATSGTSELTPSSEYPNLLPSQCILSVSEICVVLASFIVLFHISSLAASNPSLRSS